MDTRYFYHSFPRPRPGDQQDYIVAKGLEILSSMKAMGLVLAPEILVWKQPLADGSNRETRIAQSRLCFTELDRSELAEHGTKFGPFALEFSIDALRRFGALPAIYMPQNLKYDRTFSSVGATIVTQLADARFTMEKLHELSRHADPNYVLQNIAPPGATFAGEDFPVCLANTDDNNNVAQVFQVSAKAIRDVLSYIGWRNAPLELMLGVLTFVQNLYYPTDDEIHDEVLAYYRQREWKLVPGMVINGVPHSQLLAEHEKQTLLTINQRFWSREISDGRSAFRRVDRAYIMNEFDGKPITETITRILVPSAAYDQAAALFGAKVEIADATTPNR